MGHHDPPPSTLHTSSIGLDAVGWAVKMNNDLITSTRTFTATMTVTVTVTVMNGLLTG